jgi:hypothetical protein
MSSARGPEERAGAAEAAAFGRLLAAPAELFAALPPLPLPASLGPAGRERLLAAARRSGGRERWVSEDWRPP